MLPKLVTFAILLCITPADAVRSEDSVPKPRVIATIPRIRVFCSPCIDSYAQEIVPRTVAWVFNGTAVPGWTRADGALRIPQPVSRPIAPHASGPRPPVRILIDGGVFDPATVYVRVDDSWQNLAILFDLPADQALPTLESYIPVQRAPLQEHRPGDEAW